MSVTNYGGRKEKWPIDKLPACVLDYIAGFLCCEGEVGDRRLHPLVVFGSVCRTWAGVCSTDLWVAVWTETHTVLIEDACGRFVKSLYGERLNSVQREKGARSFKKQLKTAGPAECLELGLLPRCAPTWCTAPRQYQQVLFKALQFCCFQVTSARVELQCTRGSIPVIESCAVLFSLIHITWGGYLFLSAPSQQFRILIRPMYCITVTWAFYLGAYAVYRVKLAAIHNIPEEAAQLWDLKKSRRMKVKKGFAWGLRYLKSDSHTKHAVAWLVCLVLSVTFWHAEAEGYFKEPLTLTRLLCLVFAPPTFTATLVAGQRSGRKIGLLAGTMVVAILCLIVAAPSLLFIGLGSWALTCLFKLHRGFYHPPRMASPLVSFSRKMGQVVLLNIVMLSVFWFVAFDCFIPMLVFAIASLAVWVGTSVVIPLMHRCQSLRVPLPIAYVMTQVIVAAMGYAGAPVLGESCEGEL